MQDANDPRRAIEAILMVADDPVEPHLLAQLLELAPARVEEICTEMAAAYEAERRGFVLARVAGGYRFQSAPDLAPYLERFVLEGQAARLSSAALETLAIVAYKQPLSRAQVAAIRGVNVDGVMRTLQQRGYIEEVGRDPGPGQALLFGTTSSFLTKLGIDSVHDLPPLGAFVPGPEVMEALEHGLRVQPDEPPVIDDQPGTGEVPDMGQEPPVRDAGGGGGAEVPDGRPGGGGLVVPDGVDGDDDAGGERPDAGGADAGAQREAERLHGNEPIAEGAVADVAEVTEADVAERTGAEAVQEPPAVDVPVGDAGPAVHDDDQASSVSDGEAMPSASTGARFPGSSEHGGAVPSGAPAYRPEAGEAPPPAEPDAADGVDRPVVELVDRPPAAGGTPGAPVVRDPAEPSVSERSDLRHDRDHER